ncbi:MAG: hypothetical protein AAF614_29610 [Chloroflexota bacterium]
MEQFAPTHRNFVSYIDKSRTYYLDKGYGNPYRWAMHNASPFTPLTKPLAESRVGLVTTAALDEEGGRDRRVFAAPTMPTPEPLYTHHLSWHKKATHTDDLETYLPIRTVQTLADGGRIQSLSPRFYGVPTKFSQRLTKEHHAPAILDYCREDEVDVALLVAL